MRLSIFEGAFAMFFINWTSGSVLTGCALYLGAGPLALALVASLPQLAQGAAPLFAWLAGKLGRRRVAVALAAFGRGLWLLVPLLLLAPMPKEAKLAAILGVLAVSNVFIAGNGTLWLAWMGDVVPEGVRGRYFGTRNALMGVVGVAVSFLGGTWLDRVPSPLDFTVLLSLAVVMGVVASIVLSFHAHPRSDREALKMRAAFAEPLRDRNFRRLLAFAGYWQFSVLLGGAFVVPYFLSHLRMTFTQIAVWEAISAFATLAIGPWWGRVADRVGHRPVLAFTTFLAGTLLPLSWMLASPQHIWPIWLSAVLNALVWSAIGPGVFNLLFASVPPATRTSFVGVLVAVMGLAGFLGGVLAGPLLSLFEQLTFDAGSFVWTPYHWLFSLSALLRAGAWLLLRRVHEEKAWRTRDFLRGLVPS